MLYIFTANWFYSKVYALSMQTTNSRNVMNSDDAVLAAIGPNLSQRIFLHTSYQFILHLALEMRR